MIARTFSSFPTNWRIVVDSSSSISRVRKTSNAGRPDASASSATVLPTASGLREPEIWMVSHSTGTPWQPSEPTTSRT